MLDFDDDPTLADLLPDEQRQRLQRALSVLTGQQLTLTASDEHPDSGGRPIEFNLNTLAWLNGPLTPDQQQAAADLVQQILWYSARYQLAANLHRDTTEASFAELQQQNEALKASEARYRTLSEELQQRVEDQVRTIQQAQQELYANARTRSIGHLAAGVAHEINNPIGFIKSNLKVAADYLNELDDILASNESTATTSRELLTDFRDLIDESLDGARRIARIVADLKTFSSIDQSGQDLCNVNELLKAAIHLLESSHSQRRLTFDTRLEQIPDLPGYPARLSEALFNILDNAARAVGDEGTIHIRTRPTPKGVMIVIQDDGEGMDDETRDHAFDPFFTTRPVGEGTGLGLSVTRDTIRAHRGRITMESRQAAGTRVTILLPTTHPSRPATG